MQITYFNSVWVTNKTFNKNMKIKKKNRGSKNHWNAKILRYLGFVFVDHHFHGNTSGSQC